MNSTIDMETIYSIKDERVAFARELAASKGRIAHQACLLEGKEQIRWAISQRVLIKHIFIHDRLENDEFIDYLRENGIELFAVSDGILKKITDTNYIVPFVGVAMTDQLLQDPIQDFVVVLDNLQDHGNIGTIVRTAHAFDIRDIIFTSINSDLFFKKAIDASRGTVFDSHVKKYDSAIAAVKDLQKRGYQVIATSPHAKTIQSLLSLEKRPVALIVGNETDGSTQEVLEASDIVVQIPMYNAVESLNVSIAASISMYELQIKLLMVMIQDKIQGLLGREISVTSQLIRKVFDAELKKVGNIDAAQLILLMVLVFDQTMSYAQITQAIGKAGQELDNLLQPLLDNGSIKITQTGDEKQITLLQSGQELLAKLWHVAKNSEAKILEGFSESDKQKLKEMLGKIQDNCQKILST